MVELILNSVVRVRQQKMLAKLLSGLDINEEESQLYSFLLESGPLPAGKIATLIGCPRSSLYGVLSRLQERGLVGQSVHQGVKVFAAQDPTSVVLLFQRRIDELAANQSEYKKLLPSLLRHGSAGLLAPRFQVYEGGEGLKGVLQNMLLYSNIETMALWPIKAMVEILGEQFFRHLNKERIKSRIYTRAIWPASQTLDTRQHGYLGAGQGFLREIRIAPRNLTFSMGYWIYADKVAFLSSKHESFGFIVQSRELVELQTVQFEVLWRISQVLQTNCNATADFLRDLT